MFEVGKMLLGLFTFIIFFAAILFLAYVSTKFLGSKMSRGMKGKHLKVVDTIVLGFDRQIYLIKAGEQLFLVSSSNKNINFLTLLDNNSVKLTEEDIKSMDQEQPINVSNMFSSYLDKFRGLSKKTEIETPEESSNAETNRFSNNLSKLKGIFSKINSQKNEDEKPNE